MQHRFRHLVRDQRGMAFVYVGFGFMAFFAATTLAIDVGMFMTARSQAQNSADAGALAGAVALAFNDYSDRTAGGPAVQSALSAARANQVMGAAVDISPSDVTFPTDSNGLANLVHVDVYRTAGRQNAVDALIGPIFGVKTVDITASATAQAAPANAETCVKPFTIPDKWIEQQEGAWDPDDSFDLYDNKEKPLPNPDIYIPADQPGYTGYNADRDRGLEIVLKANNGSKATASFYNPWDLPGSEGADDYSVNISGCNANVIPIGFDMPPKTGNMVGPTAEGMALLVGSDAGAYWDHGCNCVKGSAFGISPRIVAIPVYDPIAFANGQQHGKVIKLVVVNYVGFFIEAMQGSEVVGRITPIAGVFAADAGPAPAGAFPKVIRLVE